MFNQEYDFFDWEQYLENYPELKVAETKEFKGVDEVIKFIENLITSTTVINAINGSIINADNTNPIAVSFLPNILNPLCLYIYRTLHSVAMSEIYY